MEGMGRPLAVHDLDDPAPEPGEVVLRVDACGICGSDLHASDQLPFSDLVLGHEFCGTVAALGNNVSGWSVGDRAVALSLATCGRCVACLSGRVRKCPEAQMVGIERAGGYAEFVALPTQALLAMPEPLDHRHGALIEPLAVALHAVQRAGVRTGDDVVVLGAGPVGLAVVLWLDRLGTREIVVSDPAAQRREAATNLGATLVLDPTAADVPGEAAERCGGAPANVIECVGVPGLLQQATEVVGVDGTATIAGVCMAEEPVVPIVAMSKELDVRFAFYYRRQDMVGTIDLIARGRLDPLPLVTDEIALDAVPERFEALKTPSTDCKVLIRP